MSLRANVLAAVVTATAALVLSLLLLEDPLVKYRLISHAREDLTRAAAEALRQIRQGVSPDVVADQVGAEMACRVTLVAEESVVGDSAFASTMLDGARQALGDEVGRARRQGQAFSLAGDGGGEGPTLLVAAVRGDGGLVARAARPLRIIQSSREATRELLLVGGMIAGIAAALLTLVLSRTLVRPVEELTRTADALAQGDLAARTHSERADELGRVARSLDRMADQLGDRVSAMRAEQARLRTILDAMVEAVFVTDRRGTIDLTNDAFERLVSLETHGRTVTEVIRDEQLERSVGLALKGQAQSEEIDVNVAGDSRTLSVQLAPLPDGRGIVGVLHDVTDRKRTDRIRRDFVANASHELRTPLTAIRGFAETLRDGAAADPEAGARFLEAILRHTTRLQRLVDDLLALSRSESTDQEFELGPVDAGAIAADIVTSLELQAKQRGVEVTVTGFEGLPAVLANAWALDHVLVNLLDNALKYTPAGGRVRLDAAEAEDRVTILVTDTGPGIAESQQARIFERFFRVDSGRTRDQGGTGLGLAIVKHLVQRMRATIEVAESSSAGTTFRIDLARAPEADPRSSGPGSVVAS